MYRKRHRTTFSQQQLSVLEEAFKQNIYPSPSLREAIALQTNLDASRVQVWFQNRRAKHKRQVSQVSQVIRNFTSYTNGGAHQAVVMPSSAAAAALEAALSNDDFCIADQIIGDSCANDLSNCYEDAYEPVANQFVVQHQQNLIRSHNHHLQQQAISREQLSQAEQQQQQQHHQHQQQPHRQQLEELQQEQQRQHSQDERQSQYYNYYRQQIGSLTSMTEFLQS